MLIISIALLTSFIITFISLPVIIKVSHQKNLFDTPSQRKIHKEPVSPFGGVAIFLAVIISSCIFWPYEGTNNDLYSIVAASIIIFFLGLKDDLVGISPKKKFIGEILAAAILVFKQDLLINSFHSLFGLHQISPLFSLVLTFLTIILIINAYNLIDGIDGLSSSLGCLSTFIFGTFFFLTNQLHYAVLCSSLLGALVAFLLFNIHPAKVFMGDTGSLILGLINSIFAIKLIEVSSNITENNYLNSLSGPIIAMAIIFVPLFDAVRVFSIRIIQGRSPFVAERNHIHHILLNNGVGHTGTTSILVCFNILVIAFAWYLREANSTLTLLFIVLLGSCFYLVANQFTLNIKRSKNIYNNSLKELKKNTK